MQLRNRRLIPTQILCDSTISVNNNDKLENSNIALHEDNTRAGTPKKHVISNEEQAKNINITSNRTRIGTSNTEYGNNEYYSIENTNLTNPATNQINLQSSKEKKKQSRNVQLPLNQPKVDVIEELIAHQIRELRLKQDSHNLATHANANNYSNNHVNNNHNFKVFQPSCPCNCNINVVDNNRRNSILSSENTPNSSNAKSIIYKKSPQVLCNSTTDVTQCKFYEPNTSHNVSINDIESHNTSFSSSCESSGSYISAYDDTLITNSSNISTSNVNCISEINTDSAVDYTSITNSSKISTSNMNCISEINTDKTNKTHIDDGNIIITNAENANKNVTSDIKEIITILKLLQSTENAIILSNYTLINAIELFLLNLKKHSQLYNKIDQYKKTTLLIGDINLTNIFCSDLEHLNQIQTIRSNKIEDVLKCINTTKIHHNYIICFSHFVNKEMELKQIIYSIRMRNKTANIYFTESIYTKYEEIKQSNFINDNPDIDVISLKIDETNNKSIFNHKPHKDKPLNRAHALKLISHLSKHSPLNINHINILINTTQISNKRLTSTQANKITYKQENFKIHHKTQKTNTNALKTNQNSLPSLPVQIYHDQKQQFFSPKHQQSQQHSTHSRIDSMKYDRNRKQHRNYAQHNNPQYAMQLPENHYQSFQQRHKCQIIHNSPNINITHHNIPQKHYHNLLQQPNYSKSMTHQHNQSQYTTQQPKKQYRSLQEQQHYPNQRKYHKIPQQSPNKQCTTENPPKYSQYIKYQQTWSSNNPVENTQYLHHNKTLQPQQLTPKQKHNQHKNSKTIAKIQKTKDYLQKDNYIFHRNHNKFACLENLEDTYYTEDENKQARKHNQTKQNTAQPTLNQQHQENEQMKQLQHKYPQNYKETVYPTQHKQLQGKKHINSVKNYNNPQQYQKHALHKQQHTKQQPIQRDQSLQQQKYYLNPHNYTKISQQSPNKNYTTQSQPNNIHYIKNQQTQSSHNSHRNTQYLQNRYEVLNHCSNTNDTEDKCKQTGKDKQDEFPTTNKISTQLKIDDATYIKQTLGLKIVNTPGDGHCLLHAFLESTKHQHNDITPINNETYDNRMKNIIEMIYKYTEKNINHFAEFTEAKPQKLCSEMKNYLENKIYENEYAHLVPHILANTTNFTIHIIDNQEKSKFSNTITIQPSCNVSSQPSGSKKEVYLYRRKDHYSALIPCNPII